MVEITPNLEEVESKQTGFAPIEAGTYSAKIDSADWDTNTGRLAVAYSITTDGTFMGRKVWQNIPISGPHAWVFTKFHMAALHEPYVKDQSVDTTVYIGREVDLTVEPREYNGKTYTNVKAVTAR